MTQGEGRAKLVDDIWMLGHLIGRIDTIDHQVGEFWQMVTDLRPDVAAVSGVADRALVDAFEALAEVGIALGLARRALDGISDEFVKHRKILNAEQGGA